MGGRLRGWLWGGGRFLPGAAHAKCGPPQVSIGPHKLRHLSTSRQGMLSICLANPGAINLHMRRQTVFFSIPPLNEWLLLSGWCAFFFEVCVGFVCVWKVDWIVFVCCCFWGIYDLF